MTASSLANGWQRLFIVASSVVLIVAALFFAKAVLIPVVMAMLLTFVLNPVVHGLQRRGLGRIPAAVLAVLLTIGLVSGVGLVVGTQFKNLAEDLPRHEKQIIAKIDSVRNTGSGTWLQNLSSTLTRTIRHAKGEPTAPLGNAETEPLPVKLESSNLPPVGSVAGPVIELVINGVLLVALVLFMLVHRENLRNRFIRLMGNGSLSSMTKALDDAGQRIGRFLLMQLAINTAFGLAIGMGLFVIGVPYALFWGFLSGMLRYIPYVGAWVAAALPTLFSVAVLPGWTAPLLVIGLFVGLDLLTSNLVEPRLYGKSIGVSEVALLIAALFWTWLWGAIGLVLAAPLTACLVVLGRYVPQMEFFSILLGDDPVLEAHVRYYQRLLAKDQDEAADLVEEYLQTRPAEEVYNRLLLPALVLTKQHRERGQLSEEDERFILEITREVVDDVVLPRQQAAGQSSTERWDPDDAVGPPERVLMFGCPARDEVDELALYLFSQLLDSRRCAFELISPEKLSAEVVSQVQEDGPALVCIAALPPKGLAHTRYLCKRLRTQFPVLKILVGCWGLEHAVEQTRERLQASGADQVGTTLLETRNQVMPLIQVRAHIQQAEPATATF